MRTGVKTIDFFLPKKTRLWVFSGKVYEKCEEEKFRDTQALPAPRADLV